MKVKLGIAGLAAILCVTGCGKSKEDARMERVHDIMSDVLEPAAEGVWDAAGWVITEEGEEELWPTTDEGWNKVAESAEIIADTARLLQGPAYAPKQGDWNEIADGLIVAADRVRTSAENREKQELFDAGGHLYRVCVACHQRYMIEDNEGMTDGDGS